MADNNQVERLRTALSEVRANREHFTGDSLTQIILALMERLRKVQTTKNKATTSKPLGDEIRLVTVMFVDVVDATAMAQDMDNSDWKNILNTTHTRIADVVTRHHGQVGQYLGDGLLSFFGVSHSRTDDALRAVTCALAIQHALESFANEVFLQHGKEFAVRIALSTGRLVVGMIGTATKQERLALGPATNLASRLQSLAPAGGIVIDANTYSRVHPHFIIQPQPPVILKGFDEPTPYYLIIDRQTPRSTPIVTTHLVGLEMPFINRHQERQTIQQAFKTAQTTRQCHSLTLVGALGLGKSRLLYQTLQDAPAQVHSFVAVAQYERRNTSYNILRDMLLRLSDLAEDTPQDVARQRIKTTLTQLWQDAQADIGATIIAFMAGFGGEDSPHVQPLLRGTQDGTYTGLTWVLRFFQFCALNAPLLIVVDNLQWADNDSRTLLKYLVDNLADTPSFFLMAMRDEPPHNPLQFTPERHTTLNLAPFTRADTAQLVNHVRQYVTNAPDTLVNIIQERAEGNPFFIIEFLGMLFDNRVFQPVAEGQWQWDRLQYEATTSHLPDGLIGVLQARMDDLSPQARQVLQAAAVVGQTFWQDVVEEITGFEITDHLTSLVQRDMIYANADSGFEGELQFTFRHALYRDVAYEMLPRTTREAHHRTVAAWFVIRIAGKSDYYRTLAEHFEYGAQYEAALFTYLEAVENRITRGLMSEALDMIDRGLSLARNVPRDVALVVVCQLWVMRATLYNELLRYDEAIAASQTALQQLEEIPHDQLIHVRVEASRMLGIAHRNLGDYSQSISALSQGFEIMPEDDPAQLADMLRSFGSLSLYMGLLDEALAYQQRSYDYARHSQIQTSITGATTQLGLIYLEKGDIARALTLFEDVLKINHERAYLHFQVGDLRNIGQVYDTLMSYERALAVYEEARERQRNLGHPDNLLDALHGLCLMRRGDVQIGLTQVRDAVANGHVDVYHNHQLHRTLVQALHHATDYAACIEHAHNFLDNVPNINPIIRARILHDIGQAHLAQGATSQAHHYLDQALALEAEYGGRYLWQIHLTLAHAHDTTQPAIAAQYRQRAAQIVRQWDEALANHPDLRYVFQQTPPIHDLLA